MKAHPVNPFANSIAKSVFFALACVRSDIATEDFRERLSQLLAEMKADLVKHTSDNGQCSEEITLFLLAFEASALDSFSRLTWSADKRQAMRRLH